MGDTVARVQLEPETQHARKAFYEFKSAANPMWDEKDNPIARVRKSLIRIKHAFICLRNASDVDERSAMFSDVVFNLACAKVAALNAGPIYSQETATRSVEGLQGCETLMNLLAHNVNSQGLEDFTDDPVLLVLLKEVENKVDALGEEWGEVFSAHNKRTLIPSQVFWELDSRGQTRWSERMLMFSEGRLSQAIGVRRDAQRRLRPIANSRFWGNEFALQMALDEVVSSKHAVTVLCDERGSGKTTLARSIAAFAASQANSHRREGFLADVLFFDCNGLSSVSDFAALLLNNLLEHSSVIPQRFEDQAETILTSLSSLDPHNGKQLWVFDEFDGIIEDAIKSQPKGLRGSFLQQCFVGHSNVHFIVTVGDRNIKAHGGDVFGSSFSVKSLKEVSRGGKAEPGNSQNPLAVAMLRAVEELIGADKLVEVGSKSSGGTFLEQVAAKSWAALDLQSKEVLKRLVLIPAGVWHDSRPSTENQPSIPWEQYFGSERWVDSLKVLEALFWVVKDLDHLDSSGQTYVWKLRPALVGFVKQQGVREEFRRKCVWYWARCIRRWSRQISARATDGVEPRIGAGEKDESVVLREERARYMLDVSRPNWQYAFSLLMQGAVERNVRNLCGVYLRGTICFCRMVGLQSVFLEMVERALQKLLSLQSSRAASAWRRAFHAVSVASCYGMKGRTLRRLGSLPEARREVLKALSLLEPHCATYKRARREKAWALTELARLELDMGLLKDSEKHVRDAIDERESLLAGRTDGVKSAKQGGRISDDERQLATSLNVYGNLLVETVRYEEAERFQRRSLEIRERLGKAHNSFRRYIAHTRNDLGNALFHQDRLEDALRLYSLALEDRMALVPNPLSALGQYVARSCHNIGNTFRKCGELDKAEKFLNQALAIYRIAIAEQPSRFSDLLARTLAIVGTVLYHQGRVGEAVKVLKESSSLHRRASASRVFVFDWCEALNVLAMAHFENQSTQLAFASLDAAEALLKRGRRVCETNFRLQRAYLLNTRGRLLFRLGGDLSEVEVLLRECLELRSSLADERSAYRDSTQMSQVYHDLGCALSRSKPEEARKMLFAALEINERMLHKRPKFVARLIARNKAALAKLLVEQRDSEAREYALEARFLFLKVREENPNAFERELLEVEEFLERYFAKVEG